MQKVSCSKEIVTEDRITQKCHYCEKFIAIEDLKNHIAVMHDGEEHFSRIEENNKLKEILRNSGFRKCHYCEKFMAIKDLKNHFGACSHKEKEIWRNSGFRKMYICGHCSGCLKQFDCGICKFCLDKNSKEICLYRWCDIKLQKEKEKISKKEKVVIVENEQQKCEYCGIFVGKNDLQMHISSCILYLSSSDFQYQNEKNEKIKLKCQFCEIIFNKEKLKGHISAMHTCNVCKKYFKKTKDLKKHIFNGHK